MTPQTSKTLVKRQPLPMQSFCSFDGTENIARQELATVPPRAQVVAQAVGQHYGGASHKVDAAERDIWLFFNQECNQGWHPEPKYGTAAIRNLADCLVDLAQTRYASLNVAYFQANIASRYYKTTIREDVEMCRALCTETLASIKADMQNISSRFSKLWGLEGPIMRALRGCISPAENTATVHLHIQEAELTHVEILSILINISQRWKLFYSHVDDLMSALSDQLSCSYKGRATVRDRRDAAMTRLDNCEREKQCISVQVKGVNSRLANINQNVVSTKAEVEMVAERIESLSAELERVKLDSKAIERELKERPEMFEATKQLEVQRQQRVHQNSAPDTWGTWAWSWVAADTSGEAARIEAWKAEEKEYEEWYASAIRRRPELANKIARTEMILAQSELRKKSLSGDKIQRQLEKFESQRREVNSQLIDAQPKLHKLNKEIEDLTRVSSKEQALLDALDDYAKIVPGLSGNLRELVININLARRDYEQVLERYQDSSSQLQKAFQKMKSPSPQEEEDINMLCDDIIRIRINYLVMAAASAWSSAVSKELYDEALRHLAPLGTSTDSSSLVPGRMIRLDDTHNAHADIYQMSRLAEEKGTSMNNMHYAGVETLRPHVHDIISSVKSVRPSKASRWSFSKKNRKSSAESPLPGGNIGELA